jgi:Prokaryotic N-terminal methylation motif
VKRLPRARHAGFTIVEVLVALGILLFGMAAVIGMLTFGTALSRTALLRTSSSAAAQAVVADLEETLFPMKDGEAGEPVDVVDRPLAGMPDVVYSARATQNPEQPLEYRVDVELSWKAAGVKREMRFTTLLVREIPFGERLRRRFVEGLGDATRPPAETAPAAPAKR